MTQDGGATWSPGFRQLFESEHGYVCRTLRRFGIRDADVEDLAHDVFLAAYLAFDGFDRSRPVKPWLVGICFRIASHHRRRASTRYEHPDEAAGVDRAHGDPLPDEQLEDARKRRLVLELLETIDLDRRAVLVMHDLDGIAMRDIAATLEIPVFTGYSRLRAAREELGAAAQRFRARGGAR